MASLGTKSFQSDEKRRQVLKQQVSEFQKDPRIKDAEKMIENMNKIWTLLNDKRNYSIERDPKTKKIKSVTFNQAAQARILFATAKELNGAGVLTDRDLERSGPSQAWGNLVDLFLGRIQDGDVLTAQDMFNLFTASRSLAPQLKDMVAKKGRQRAFITAPLTKGSEKDLIKFFNGISDKFAAGTLAKISSRDPRGIQAILQSPDVDVKFPSTVERVKKAVKSALSESESERLNFLKEQKKVRNLTDDEFIEEKRLEKKKSQNKP
jgi:hypothetical protein